MDSSETYIKMCEKAEEIQKLSMRVPRDWYVCPICHTVMSEDDGYLYGCPHAGEITLIWLPRQDQLQAMMKEDNPANQLLKFYHFVFDVWCDYGESLEEELREEMKHFTSMEQLWLAFVMKERFSKSWNGAEWI